MNKMIDRFQTLTNDELIQIHNASMDILLNTGICFNSEQVTSFFKAHGFKTEGDTVFFTEQNIKKALSSTVSKFKILARNPDFNVSVGEDDFICLPTGGAPNIATIDGKQRRATLEDYISCCKLVHTSKALDMGGVIMVQPTDVSAETVHLDMIANYLIYCDKPIFGASNSGQAVIDTLEMAGMVWDGKANIRNKPVMAAVVNAMSPLQYTEEQTDVIIEMARYGQPVIITNMILAGASGPVSLPGLLALQNAEILAGITLSQLINPGTPVVYGSTSSQMDMRTSTGPVAASETVVIASATIQLARYYDLPSRTGGSLTDAHVPDAQALAEGSLMLSTVLRNGANVIYHSCGQMGSYISMSFEKWLIDEEMISNLRRIMKPLSITGETIDVETIKNVGIGGEYLTHLKTYQQFKNLSQPHLFNRKDYDKWASEGHQRIDEVAGKELEKRLASYEKPPLDPQIEKAILDYVAQRKREK
jgi:trimethylamine---corrinoid protein Co-methyltransferase